MSEIVAIVDGYGIGRFFAPKLNQLGYSCIHIQSTDNIPQYFINTFNPAHYIENIIYHGHLNEIYHQLKKYKIKFLIPGAEIGVELADQLSHNLGLISNGIALSSARRDKGQMIEALSNSGLKTAKYIVSDNINEILGWAIEIKEKPIVLKPLRSLGADLVTFCHSDIDIRNAFNKIINTKTVAYETNQKVLAQSYLKGSQLLINTVSSYGRHTISDMWKCGTPPTTNWILPYHFENSEKVIQYTFDVLDALKISHGPCHAEIMLTQDGPILIECGARVMGVFNPEFIKQATGRNQIEMTLESYLNPKAFISKFSAPYFIHNYLFVKFLESHVNRTYKGIQDYSKLSALNSFHHLYLKIQPGDKIKNTVDQLTSPGSITLMNHNEAQLNKDIEQFLVLEKDMFAV
ncbi:MAG: hypothetical protein A3C55_03880 [Gammaproteobacteria bacterium RIFCSPHIGHO2_02_FULL_42_13]|nr:MAG: hypothetical protein A3C55_03880 [Gammaproteobacteria bacterium RIFCSPHIGHO2_02_FULL_42_13]OGT67924.1 MAG: hypothetical protein A3H43_02360 [Gammaproteobacteria bacterium RIFCSPLOWO2_02_FULL_42_9]